MRANIRFFIVPIISIVSEVHIPKDYGHERRGTSGINFNDEGSWAFVQKQWSNQSHEIILSALQDPPSDDERRRVLLAYSKLGKLSTFAFVHIARTGGLSLNKLLVENRGIAGLAKFSYKLI
jgi:hypothetical protein